MNIKYLGSFGCMCQMCDNASRSVYERYPDKSIIKLLPEECKKPLRICNKCAKREAGKKWKNIKK